jgi:mono/diheme cytochrome c family protein
MRRIPFVLAGLAGTLVAMAVTAAPGAGQEAATQEAGPGKAVFEGKGNCYTCHGPEGRGTPLAPDLTDSAWVNFEEVPTVAQVEALVKAGVPSPVEHPAPMPPMGGARLSDEEVAQVAEYILSLAGGP